MKIYVCHSTAFDYKTELYEPLKSHFGASHDLVLPHEAESDFHSKTVINSSDLILAEVSYPSTGQGIELGWADSAQKPIICFHRSDVHPSAALQYISSAITTYHDTDDMIDKLTDAIQS
ncbi:hypothetical protein KBD87_04080 [Candidatus Saccharibacteria bacterium]|nr:hypothetical protein [Candidatus Saccharibacteria bacterium]